MKLLKKILMGSFFTFMVLLYSGCQKQNPTEHLSTQENINVPYSKGPTSDPSSMKGPSGSPPLPQSTQEMENVHLTLPTTTQQSQQKNSETSIVSQ